MFFWIFHKLVKMSWCANWTNIASCTFKTFRLFLQNEMKQEAFHQLTVLSVSVETKVQKGEPRIWFIYFYYSREKRMKVSIWKCILNPGLLLSLLFVPVVGFLLSTVPEGGVGDVEEWGGERGDMVVDSVDPAVWDTLSCVVLSPPLSGNDNISKHSKHSNCWK